MIEDSVPRKGKLCFLSPNLRGLAVGPTQPPVSVGTQVLYRGCVTERSLPCSAKGKNERSVTFIF
jgi:hypothetical protein